ncbi:MAG: HAD family phosphatase [Clostridia bacterium]|nr:HAD family phosphatase [Clostridia bacterium]
MAIDIDKTLLGWDGAIHPANADAVRRLMARGVRVVLATGRRWASTRAIHRNLGLSTPSVCSFGAVIVDPAEESVGYARLIPRDDAVDVIRTATREGIPLSATFQDGIWFNLEPGLPAGVSLPPDARVEADLAERLPGEPQQITVVGTEAADYLLRLFAKRQDRLRLTEILTESGEKVLYFHHPEADKATALAHLCASWGIARDEVLALGDGVNDVTMLRWAGIGVAMGWSVEAARQAADFVADPSDDAAVATAIQRFVFGEAATESCGTRGRVR